MCSIAVSKTNYFPLLCPVVPRRCQGLNSKYIAACQKVNGKKWEQRTRPIECFSIIMENIETSCSGELPKIPCPHLPPVPVSECFSFLFSRRICNDLISTHGTHLLGFHSPLVENGSGPWIICSQSLTLQTLTSVKSCHHGFLFFFYFLKKTMTSEIFEVTSLQGIL